MFELVGIQEVDFTDNTGKRVTGKTIHFLTAPEPGRKFTGKVANSKFFRSDAPMPSALQCGKHYEFIMTYTGGPNPKLIGFKEVKA